MFTSCRLVQAVGRFTLRAVRVVLAVLVTLAVRFGMIFLEGYVSKSVSAQPYIYSAQSELHQPRKNQSLVKFREGKGREFGK